MCVFDLLSVALPPWSLYLIILLTSECARRRRGGTAIGYDETEGSKSGGQEKQVLGRG